MDRHVTVHRERHGAGLAVRGRVLGGDPAESHLAAVKIHGSVGAWVDDYMFGECWSRPGLTLRDRLVATIAATGALGQSEAVQVAAAAAVRGGVTGAELGCVVGYLLGYAGAPVAVAASRAVGAAVAAAGGSWPPDGAAEEKDDDARRADGYDVMRTLGGGRVPPSPEAARDWFTTSFGDLGALVFEWAFGELWVHGPLTRRDRSLVVLAICVTQPAEHELVAHARGGLNHGLSRTEIEEIMITLAPVVGFPRTVGATRALRGLWASLDGAAGGAGQ